MSADSWSVCPRCEAQAIRRWESASAKVEADYGKVSRAEYDRRWGVIQRTPKPDFSNDENRALREDYSIGISSEGIFAVSYHAHCADCEYDYRFRQEEAAPKPLVGGGE